MRKMYLLCLFAVILSCGKNEHYDKIPVSAMAVVSEPSEMDAKLVPPPKSIQEKEISTGTQNISQKIIKSGRIEIEVGDINKAQKIIADNLKKSNAYKQGEFFSNSEEQ